MEKEQLIRIFNFLKLKEGKRHNQQDTLRWKLIFNQPITKKELNIKGDLYLRDSKITSLPKGFNVKGDLDLSYSKIKSLPEGLEVGGYLKLSYSKITSLPEGLKVGGDLDLYWTDITSLPKGLKVGGKLVIRETELLKLSDEELRDMVKPGFIKGEIMR